MHEGALDLHVPHLVPCLDGIICGCPQLALILPDPRTFGQLLLRTLRLLAARLQHLGFQHVLLLHHRGLDLQVGRCHLTQGFVDACPAGWTRLEALQRASHVRHLLVELLQLALQLRARLSLRLREACHELLELLTLLLHQRLQLHRAGGELLLDLARGGDVLLQAQVRRLGRLRAGRRALHLAAIFFGRLELQTLLVELGLELVGRHVGLGELLLQPHRALLQGLHLLLQLVVLQALQLQTAALPALGERPELSLEVAGAPLLLRQLLLQRFPQAPLLEVGRDQLLHHRLLHILHGHQPGGGLGRLALLRAELRLDALQLRVQRGFGLLGPGRGGLEHLQLLLELLC
mmetsp:Transcript_27943/g.66330  ORF Transcript_27943/g.66330 Transcript_27943/m.66330 type:complete len:348 (+) Transcript_27943:242-1285(+)